MICGVTPTYGGCMGGWVDDYVDGLCQVKITKNEINHDLIELFLFCLKMYDL